jgi:hypothetical protein
MLWAWGRKSARVETIVRTNRSTVALLTVVLVPSLLGLQMPARATGATSALSGSIFRAADQSPLVGARLHAGDPKSGQLFSSPPTGDDGSFALADLPAATYQLAVEADGGLYRVETPLPLASGTSRTLNLAVTRQPGNGFGENGTVEDDDDSDDFGPWDNPLSAALVSLGIAAVVGVAVWGSDDGDATPGSSSKFVPED